MRYSLCRSQAALTEHVQVNRRGKKLDVTLHRAHFGVKGRGKREEGKRKEGRGGRKEEGGE